MKAPTIGNFTAERITALLATLAAVLVGVVALHLGADLFDVAGAALIAYVVTVVGVAVKGQQKLSLAKILAATTKGALIGSVLTVIVLIGIVRAFKGMV
ncbi:hypothetical protein [Streptomyces sp. SS]|uniref:hypothetical protein n=1 Tax=Streptomyces sp. SS TaxID=260742 RepID=UPI0002D9499B|nr:hypothetical protein [Streptomyces sp. SS]